MFSFPLEFSGGGSCSYCLTFLRDPTVGPCSGDEGEAYPALGVFFSARVRDWLPQAHSVACDRVSPHHHKLLPCEEDIPLSLTCGSVLGLLMLGG